MNKDQRESATPIGDIVSHLIRETERDSVQPLNRLKTAWSTITKAGHLEGTRVKAYSSGVVIIEVKSPPLCAELSQFRRREIMAQLRLELAGSPALEEIKFRLGAW